MNERSHFDDIYAAVHIFRVIYREQDRLKSYSSITGAAHCRAAFITRLTNLIAESVGLIKKLIERLVRDKSRIFFHIYTLNF